MKPTRAEGWRSCGSLWCERIRCGSGSFVDTSRQGRDLRARDVGQGVQLRQGDRRGRQLGVGRPRSGASLLPR